MPSESTALQIGFLKELKLSLQDLLMPENVNFHYQSGPKKEGKLSPECFFFFFFFTPMLRFQLKRRRFGVI